MAEFWSYIKSRVLSMQMVREVNGTGRIIAVGEDGQFFVARIHKNLKIIIIKVIGTHALSNFFALSQAELIFKHRWRCGA